MTSLTLEVPDELADRLARVPPDQVNRFAIAALSRFAPDPLPRLEAVIAPVTALVTLRDGWNGPGSLAADPATVARTVEWLVGLVEEVRLSGLPWSAPLCNPGSAGDVVLEWWSGAKKLTVYVTSDTVEYLKAWGPDIEADMAEGDAADADTRRELWAWLTRP
jgi:hypothetical protein